MKHATAIGIFLVLLLLFSGCPTIDPLKDLPQTEYDQAQKYRARIEKFQLAVYAQDEFNAGETAFKAGEGNLKKDNLAAKKSLDEANGNYRVVIKKGLAALRKLKDDDVTASRQKADTIKSAVAAAQEYKDAQDTYDKAAALAESENWEEAEPLFAEAKRKFVAAFEAAAVKKQKADAQFEKTKNAMDALNANQGGQTK
jgi:hypothetical protein